MELTELAVTPNEAYRPTVVREDCMGTIVRYRHICAQSTYHTSPCDSLRWAAYQQRENVVLFIMGMMFGDDAQQPLPRDVLYCICQLSGLVLYDPARQLSCGRPIHNSQDYTDEQLQTLPLYAMLHLGQRFNYPYFQFIPPVVPFLEWAGWFQLPQSNEEHQVYDDALFHRIREHVWSNRYVYVPPPPHIGDADDESSE